MMTHTKSVDHVIIPFPSIPLEGVVPLVVTSGLTSVDVRLTSVLRSPDETDEVEGSSITRLRFV
jgi:hypothetical protein